MAESGLRRRIIELIKGTGLMAIAVENAVLPGTPDIWWGGGVRGGWIETKLLPALPVRASTCFRVPGLTVAQREFHEKAERADVRSLVVVRVAASGEWIVIQNSSLPKVMSTDVIGNPERALTLAQLEAEEGSGVERILKSAASDVRLTSLGVLW